MLEQLLTDPGSRVWVEWVGGGGGASAKAGAPPASLPLGTLSEKISQSRPQASEEAPKPALPTKSPLRETGIIPTAPSLHCLSSYFVYRYAGPPDTYHLPRHTLSVKKGVIF